MGIEFEIKFRATQAQQRSLRAAYPGDAQTISMETTYYDTPGGALAQRWFTLRRRMENDCSVCTLKTPADGFGRGEFEVECDCIEAAIPELCKLSGVSELPALVAEGIVPVCGAKFTRIARTLIFPDVTLELALDSGILTGGGKEVPLCEVEVELKSGSREAALLFARKLAATYGLEPEQKSKFRRALALAKEE